MNYRARTVTIAKTQVTTNDHAYTPQGNNWFFIGWLLQQAKIPHLISPELTSNELAVCWAKKMKIWRPRLTKHAPVSGEIVVFDWRLDGIQDHVGIVESTTTNNVTVIECCHVKDGEDCICRKVYSRSSKYILGYIDLQYPAPIVRIGG